MNLRINDSPVYKGKIEDNFITPSNDNSYPVYVHEQKSTGHNYNMVKSGHVGIKPGSEAQKCIENLIFGCGRIDIIEDSGHYLACFRDAKVLVSTYLEITGKNVKEAIS